MRRSIQIFPKFENLSNIEKIREEWDPLSGFISPHITIVFPFESDIPIKVLEDHIKSSIQGISTFEIVLSGITGYNKEFLFLNVKVGNDKIIEIHDRVYTGALSSFLDRRNTYFPHLSVGKFKKEIDLMNALIETEKYTEKFDTTVTELIIERIEDDEKSSIESIVKFS